MINGVLIINHSLKSKKFDELYEWLRKSAYELNVELSVLTNREILIDTEKFSLSKKYNFVLFWDKDVLLAKYLENQGFKIFNQSKAIEICDDKALTHIMLSKYNIPMPRTLIPPLTFIEKVDDRLSKEVEHILNSVQEQLSYPFILKARKGSFGAQVHLVYNYREVLDIVNIYGINNVIFQEYIASSKGRDMRLQVVGDDVVATMYRYSDNDFRANISNGGKMKKIRPSKEAKEIAIKATKLMGLDFAGVDILFGNNDKPILCEVNSNAHFINIYNCTGINVADYIIKHIVNELQKSELNIGDK